MTEIINFFLIAPTSELVGLFYKNTHKFRKGGFSVLIHDSKPLVEILDGFSPDVQFRVLVHMEYKGKGVINMRQIKECQGWSEMITLKKAFPAGKFVFFTRENEIFPTKGEKEGEKTTFEDFTIVYGNEMTTDHFFDNIDVNTKRDLGSIEHLSIQNGIPVLDKEITPNCTILTALTTDEYDSFRENLHKEGDSRGVFIGKFKAVENYRNDYPHSLKVLRQKKMGMVDAALSTSYAFHNCNTDILIMSGVCGGRESASEIYDIIVPRNIVDIITGKYDNAKFIPYGNQEAINEELIEFISETARENDIRNRMNNLVPHNQDHKRKKEIINTLNFRYDTMACGTFVLNTNDFLEEKARQMNNKIVGFEMESYGVMRALKLCKESNKLAMVVKSVMDFTDEHKKDIKNGEPVKYLAAYMSYLYVRAVLPYVIEFYERDFYMK